jgi:hypothetical protein
MGALWPNCTLDVVVVHLVVEQRKSVNTKVPDTFSSPLCSVCMQLYVVRLFAAPTPCLSSQESDAMHGYALGVIRPPSRLWAAASSRTPCQTSQPWTATASGVLLQNVFYRAHASSSSMTRVKVSSGWAPETSRPLMKKAGVPVTPARVPSSMSCCTVVWYVPLLTQCSKAGRSSPTSWAEASNCSGLVFGAWAKRAS